jgi:hypothetical protein
LARPAAASSAQLLNAANSREINQTFFMKTSQKTGPHKEAPQG